MHLPHYLFERDGVVTEVALAMRKLEAYTEYMESHGWRRVFTPPHAIHIIPSSADSMNQAYKGEAAPPGWTKEKAMKVARGMTPRGR